MLSSHTLGASVATYRSLFAATRGARRRCCTASPTAAPSGAGEPRGEVSAVVALAADRQPRGGAIRRAGPPSLTMGSLPWWTAIRQPIPAAPTRGYRGTGPLQATAASVPSLEMAGSSLLLVDAMGLVYRAHYSFFEKREEALNVTLPNGEQVDMSAVYIFLDLLLAVVEEAQCSHVAVCWDARGAKTFRHEIHPEYKGHRAPTPPELEAAIPHMQELTVARLGLSCVEIAGAEADDAIGTLAARCVAAGGKVVVASADKDFYQLLSPNVVMLRLRTRAQRNRGIVQAMYGPAELLADTGLRSNQWADYLALVGDASDNIPGVTGCGPARSSKLLIAHGSLDGVFAAVDTDWGSSGAPRSLRDSREREAAYLSRRLATIRVNLSSPALTITPWATYRLASGSPPEDLSAFVDSLVRIEQTANLAARLRRRWASGPSLTTTPRDD